MRTTINIRREALELVRGRAEREGVSLGDAVSDAILDAYRKRPATSERRRIVLSVSGAGGLHPGVDLDDSAALEERMSGES
jgi:hypothetical protein